MTSVIDREIRDSYIIDSQIHRKKKEIKNAERGETRSDADAGISWYEEGGGGGDLNHLNFKKLLRTTEKNCLETITSVGKKDRVSTESMLVRSVTFAN